jgi:hypothetical protein
MRLGIGGRLFGVRAGISTRGVGFGAGPFSSGHSWHSRRRRKSYPKGRSGGGGGCLTIFMALLVLAVISAFLLWPYLLGAAIAVRLGAGNPSATRTLVGCLFEWPWLTLLIFVVVYYMWGMRRPAAGPHRSRVAPVIQHPPNPGQPVWNSLDVRTRSTNMPPGSPPYGIPLPVQPQTPVSALRNPSRSPVGTLFLIATAASAVLVVIGGTIALQPNQDATTNTALAPSLTTSDAAPSASIATPSVAEQAPASVAPFSPPDTSTIPLGSSIDHQGFLGYQGARCNSTNPAIAIARTSQSLVVICETGFGRLYYKGMRLSDSASVEIDDPERTDTGFTATNAGVQYTLSPSTLVITQGATQLADETVLLYWAH